MHQWACWLVAYGLWLDITLFDVGSIHCGLSDMTDCGLDISRSRNEPPYIWMTDILEWIGLHVGYSREFEKFFDWFLLLALSLGRVFVS
jgi:hypothetical protein